MAPAKQSTTKRKRHADDIPPSTPTKRIKSSFASPLKVLVGSEKTAVFVHEDVICASSAFFKAACSKTWRENQDKTVNLPAADPTTFHIYVDWLYNGDLDKDILSQKCGIEPKVENEVRKRSWKMVHSLCKLWILADYLQDAECRVGVMAMLLAPGLGVMVDTVRLVVAETADTSALFRWMVDFLSCFFSVDMAHHLPSSFQLALLRRLGKFRNSNELPIAPGPSDLDKYVDNA